MTTVRFTRDTWMPQVVEVDGALRLDVVGGADGNHDPREFTVPLREDHLEVLRTSLPRHLLLYAAMLPLCDAAGTRGDWDEQAAAALLDPVLHGTPAQVDAALRAVRVNHRTLVAHGASIPELDRRQYVDAVESATASTDWARVREWESTRRTTPRGAQPRRRPTP